MKRRAYVLTAMVVILSMVMAPAALAQAPTTDLVTDVTGEVTDADTGAAVGDFVGELDITGITRDGGMLNFVGNLTGNVVDAADNVVETVDEVVEFAANLTRDGNGNRCDILFLDIGPIHLDLLGLVVDLSDIQLDVHAVPGPGNLLGNLLCAVAGLLDGPGRGGGILNAVDRILQRITGLLG